MFETNASASTAANHFLNGNMNGNGLLANNMMHLENNQVNSHLNANHIYQNQLQLCGDQMQGKNCTANFSNIIRNIGNSALPANNHHQLYSNLNKLHLTSNNNGSPINGYQNGQNNNFGNLQNGGNAGGGGNPLQRFSNDFQQQLQNHLHQQNGGGGHLSQMPQQLLNGNLNGNQLPLQPKQLPQYNIPSVFCNPKSNQCQTPTKYQQQQQQHLFGNSNTPSSNNSPSTFHQTKSATSDQFSPMAQSHQFFNSIQQHPNLHQHQLQQLYLQLNNQNNPNILNRNLNHNLLHRNVSNVFNVNTPNAEPNYYNLLLNCQNNLNGNLNSLPSTPVNKSSLFGNNLISAGTPNHRGDHFNTSSFTFNSNGSGGSLSSNKSNSSGSDHLLSSQSSTESAPISGQLKNFKVVKQIGNGQFSVVYRAIYIPTGQFVALKCIRILELEDMKTRLDCINEISLLQRLDHENIIKFYTSFVESNDLYIVLELADCGDLAQLIKHFRKIKKTIPEKRIWSYFKQIANGLMHMHEHTILHRDLKPPNVFITNSGVVKLGDLGLSKYYGGSCKGNCCCSGPGGCLSNKETNNNGSMDSRAVLESHFNAILSPKGSKGQGTGPAATANLGNLIKTCTQQVRNNISNHKEIHYKVHKNLMQDEASSLIGTPFYMSKERLSENCKYDSQSDIWSLGCILYEMAALQSPFYGEKLNLISLCQKIVSCNYPPLADNYSVALRALVASCLDSDPKKRPDIMLICEIAKLCAELNAKDMQVVHLCSPLFKTLKLDEIISSDKLNQAKNSLSPIKNGLYSLNLNGVNRNGKSYGDANALSSPNSMTSANNLNNHLTSCVPNQMLINSVVNNNNFYPTNDCNSTGYNDLQSIDSNSLSMIKFWKCEQTSSDNNEKSFL